MAFSRRILGLGLVALGCVLAAAPAVADTLAPQTRLRLTVVRWMPITGQYEQWAAVSRELLVSASGTITVPLIGPMAVGGMDVDQLAQQIGERLQADLKLVRPPSASVEILDYPPIYVVGAVKDPGEYTFRPGMTVLHALALGGGQLRSETADGMSERIKLLADIANWRDGIVRSSARLARLEAESAQLETIDFSPLDVGSDDGGQAVPAVPAELAAEETALFDARNKAIMRQSDALSELGQLYGAEIEALQSRISDLDQSIAASSTELDGVKILVDRGIATVSRRSELERLLSGLRADRLDQLTAIMRARQYMSEADRNMAGLRDQRRTEIAQELLDERAKLTDLQNKVQTDQRLLDELDRSVAIDLSERAAVLVFSIVRQGPEGVSQSEAVEGTLLMPGDVVKAALMTRPGLPAGPETTVQPVVHPAGKEEQALAARAEEHDAHGAQEDPEVGAQ